MSKYFQKKKNKTVLVLSFSNLKSDPRVLRQVSFLSPNFDITVAGFGSIGIPVNQEFSTDFYEMNFLEEIRNALFMLLGLNRFYYWYFYPTVRFFLKKLTSLQFDLIVANDAEALPLALKLARGAPVIFDAHEYSLDELPVKNIKVLPFKKFKSWIIKKHIKRATFVTTVSAGIAQLYSEKFSIEVPTVLPNAPQYYDLRPSKSNDNKIKIVYHGLASKSRGLELLIEAMKFQKANLELHLVLVGEKKQINSLKDQSKNLENVFYHDPVETRDLPIFLNQFDVGVFFAPPTTKSLFYSLPNKFFEYIQARLAVLIAPLPEMSDYVTRYNLGLVAKGFSIEDLAVQLKCLNNENVRQFKEASNSVASQLCWEAFEGELGKLIEKATKTS